ncbi:hypothetical protein HPP92_005178 [Vanilla planifolia]|uniref:Water stress and hypersensitive response domain-containing protein n=1 Tax=Vanilla planifolia TaxID=51239 RepID=A0A835RH80_VANPL|nr:hypothetical protein HPP92_005479 [Vanilla planifolia]KAG0494184.1 hypothetical protein HPP92_005178 [Vanilla planifolia]
MSNLLNKAKEFVAEKIANVEKPEATVSHVSVKRLGRNSAHFHSEVAIDNPYSHRIPICDLTYTLKSAGRVVASGTMPDPGWIEAGGVTKLEVPFKVPYDFLMSLLRDIGRDWDIDYELEIGLTIDLPIIGNFTIPLTTAGELKLPTISDFFSKE